MQHLYFAVHVVEIHGALGVEGGDVCDETVGAKAQHQTLHHLGMVLTRTFEQNTSQVN